MWNKTHFYRMGWVRNILCGQTGRSVQLATHCPLAPWFRMRELRILPAARSIDTERTFLFTVHTSQDDPCKGWGVSGAVRGTPAPLLVGATNCSATTHRLQTSKSFTCVHWTTVLCVRVGSSNSPFSMKTCAWAFIAYLAGIVSLSEDDTFPAIKNAPFPRRNDVLSRKASGYNTEPEVSDTSQPIQQNRYLLTINFACHFE